MQYPVGKRETFRDAMNAAVQATRLTHMRYRVAFRCMSTESTRVRWFIFEPVRVHPPFDSPVEL